MKLKQLRQEWEGGIYLDDGELMGKYVIAMHPRWLFWWFRDKKVFYQHGGGTFGMNVAWGFLAWGRIGVAKGQRDNSTKLSYWFSSRPWNRITDYLRRRCVSWSIHRVAVLCPNMQEAREHFMRGRDEFRNYDNFQADLMSRVLRYRQKAEGRSRIVEHHYLYPEQVTRGLCTQGIMWRDWVAHLPENSLEYAAAIGDIKLHTVEKPFFQQGRYIGQFWYKFPFIGERRLFWFTIDRADQA